MIAHLAALEPTIRSSGGDVTPNIYCGILTIILFPLYLMSKRFSWKEKLSDFSILVLIFFLCNYNATNFILHGFHFPNDLPYRFSFVYSFLLLVIGFKVLRYIRDYSYKTLILTAGSLVLFCVLAQKFELRYADDFSIYISILFIIVYTIIICASISKKLSLLMTSLVVCCAVMCEVLICDVPKFAFGVSRSDYISNYDSYREAIQRIETEDDTPFYRLELNDIPSALRMSPCWYNYNGINNFSSMSSERNAAMQQKLGNFGNKINSFMYHNQTPVYNLMFDIKYVIDNNDPLKLNKTYYRYLSGSSETLTTYRVRQDSAIGYCVDQSLLKGWSTQEEVNPFENQNSFLKLASGIEEDVFERATLYTNGATNCSITSFENTGDGSISYSVFNEGSRAEFGMYFKAEKKANYYLYLGSQSNFSKADIETANYKKTQEIDSNPYILDLGLLEKGEQVDITAFIDEEHASGSNYVWAYSINDEVFERAYAKLSGIGMLQLSKFNQTYLKGEVTAQKGQILYTSIAFDEGWTCKVDGTEVKPYKINDCLIGLEVGEGTHTVELRYSQVGLKTGLIISGMSIGILVAYFVLKKVLMNVISNATDALLNHS